MNSAFIGVPHFRRNEKNCMQPLLKYCQKG